MFNKTIAAMLDKNNIRPFYFGGYDESYFWRAANIDKKIYVQRGRCRNGKTSESFSAFPASEADTLHDTFNEIVLDFVIYCSEIWREGNGDIANIFSDIAGRDDAEFNKILQVFDMEYANFLNYAFYWYGEVIASNNTDDAFRTEKSSLTEREHTIKKAIARYSEYSPLVITQGDFTFEWNLAKVRNEIFYSKLSYKDYGEFISCTGEYGRVAIDDADEFGALRDAIAACLMLKDRKIEDRKNLKGLLSLVDRHQRRSK